jgi:hypothetical protein
MAKPTGAGRIEDGCRGTKRTHSREPARPFVNQDSYKASDAASQAATNPTDGNMATKSKKLTPERRIMEIKRRLKANAKLTEKLKMTPARRKVKQAA